MANSEVDQFLSRDDSQLIETLSDEIVAHVSAIGTDLFGYAILTGDDTSVSHVISAYDGKVRTDHDSERFDIHSWEMCPGSFPKTDDMLEQLNAEYERLYATDPATAETDETQDAHVAELHDSIVSAMLLARKRHATLRKKNGFYIFAIPDSMLDVDLRSSQLLNSVAIHERYTQWR